MSEIAEPDAEPSTPRARAKILAAALLLVIGAVGFSSTYIGLVNPAEMLKPGAMVEGSDVPDFAFLDVPQVVLTLPGPRPRTLILSVKIEVSTGQLESIEYLMPRISDSFYLFLSDIDPAAFERRGILEIIRSELVTRSSYVLGADSFRDILITEFRIQ